jgi:hypothetical protein
VTFIKVISDPLGQKRTHFVQREGGRKNVERAFGELQARFAVVRGPAKYSPVPLYKVYLFFDKIPECKLHFF